MMFHEFVPVHLSGSYKGAAKDYRSPETLEILLENDHLIPLCFSHEHEDAGTRQMTASKREEEKSVCNHPKRELSWR